MPNLNPKKFRNSPHPDRPHDLFYEHHFHLLHFYALPEWHILFYISSQSPLFSGERNDVDPEKVKELHEILFIIDENYFPNGNEWIAGEVLTAADFAFVASISTLVVSITVLMFN